MLAVSHKALGFVDSAKAAFEVALTIDNQSAPIHAAYGQLLEDLGEFKAAADAYREALALDKAQHEALGNLLGLSRIVDVESEMQLAANQLPHLKAKEKALVAYGLGQAFAQHKNYDKAFNIYLAANNARSEIAEKFEPKRFNKRIEQMKTIFSRAFFASRKEFGIETKQPVFIVGLPRSGTTLTEQILASHSDCFGAGELGDLTDLATGTPDRLGNANVNWPECASLLSSKHVTDIAKEYLERASQRSDQQAIRVIDKQPLNFWHLGLIAMAFPKAKIIHCTRDIRDCGLSIFTQNFNLQQNWSTDLEHIAIYWQGYRELIAHFKAVSGLEFLDVSYEQPVTAIESQAKKLLDFVELPWQPAVLNFHNSKRAVQTPSRWQVRQPIYQTSKARWRNYETHLTPLIEAFAQKNI